MPYDRESVKKVDSTVGELKEKNNELVKSLDEKKAEVILTFNFQVKY